jgi:SAM-dependent methyltransferase
MNALQGLLAQFERPQGWLGQVAGTIMANRPSNVERNEWTVSLLGLGPADRVLEIGFGPGLAIRRAAETVTHGRVVGLDHSDVMLAQASRRNAARLADGRVALLLGSLAALAEVTGPFDKIFSVNVFMFWDDPVAAFRALARLLAAGGLVATTVQPRGSGATDDDASRVGDQIAHALQAAGFVDTERKLKRMKPVSSVCVLARQP